MNESLSEGIRKLKTEFSKRYKGNGHIREVIPLETSELVSINKDDLYMLHQFAQFNPIYYNSYNFDILDIPCRVYEADINQFWLDSIKHDASYQSFYPTWILSAYFLSVLLKSLGFRQAIDIGSGDGRIAYCMQLAKIRSTGLEIEQSLVELQQKIAKSTNVYFDAITTDATLFDYLVLDASKPVFFISGLPEMGGEMLAEGVLNSLKRDQRLRENAGFVFMGKTPKMGIDNDDETRLFGWDFVVDRFGLKLKQIIWLPTHWTTEQTRDTPHLYMSF